MTLTLPDAAKEVARSTARLVGRQTAGSRLTPGFLIVGAQRCGTTSLFRYLAGHPQVCPPLFNKGIHYFDVAYQKGPAWYRGHFPLRRLADLRSPGSARAVTGEASPYYLFHPCAAERIAQQLPDVRVLVMVRDPVERAFSAWRQERHRGFETEEFERALDLEVERLAGEEERLQADPSYVSFHHQHHGYAARGHYARQVERFRDLLGAEHVMVLESDPFFADPAERWDRLVDFLGLTPWRPVEFGRHNARPSQPLAPGVRARLATEFDESDAKLADLLGHAPAWSR